MTPNDLRHMHDELSTQTSGGGVFGAYQDVLIDGKVVIQGHRRTQERLDLFGLSALDVQWKAMLDLGCNLGQIVGHYSNLGAQPADGVELNPVFCRWAARLFPRAMFHCISVDDVPLQGPPLDYIFALAIWDYVDQTRLVHLVRNRVHSASVLFFEGHKVDPPVTRDEQLDLYTRIIGRFAPISITHLGWVDGGQRPVFRGVF